MSGYKFMRLSRNVLIAYTLSLTLAIGLLSVLLFVFPAQKTKPTPENTKSSVTSGDSEWEITPSEGVPIDTSGTNAKFDNIGVIGGRAYIENTTFNNEHLLKYTNINRLENNLPALKLNEQLSQSAKMKCNDMVTRDYWSHNTPDGQEPWGFLDTQGYRYVAAGENLAYGFIDESDTIQSWMNSEGHRANILNPIYSEVGFGACSSTNYINKGQQFIIVQHLAKPV